ncbi:MAG: flagellar hook-basal body complex protein FliE, partial [Dethiobacteria bacterium]
MPGVVSPLSSLQLQRNLSVENLSKKDDEKISFGEYLKSVLQYADQLQKEADQATRELVSGNLENLHDLMIATEQAQLSLQLTVQVVNKVIQAYQEVYRMQI